MFYIKDIVSKLVNSKIKDLGIYVSDAFKSSEEGKTIFNIVLDSDSVIDLNKIKEVFGDEIEDIIIRQIVIYSSVSY